MTGCKIIRILIASHIVPWSESNDIERLDADNGILLSPSADSLFDRHLISFTDQGELLLSKKLESIELQKLGISLDIKIPINEGMKKYLKRHREKVDE